MLFTDLARQLAPWSLSKAELAKNCSFQFNLKYIRKEEGKVPPRDAAGRIGTAAHKALELFLKQASAGSEELHRSILKVATDQQLTTIEADNVIALAHNIVNFRSRLDAYRERNRVVQTLEEHKFGLTDEGAVTEFYGKGAREPFFRGIMDLILRTENEDIIIIDHKSGQPPQSTAQALKQHEHQLRVYALAALYLFPKMRTVQPALHYIQNEQIVWAPARLDANAVRDQLLPWYYQFLNEAAIASQSNLPHKGWYCQFCEYIPFCPLQK